MAIEGKLDYKTGACDRCGDTRAIYTLPAFCICPRCDHGEKPEPAEKDMARFYKCLGCGAIGRFYVSQVAAGKCCDRCQGVLMVDDG